MQRQQSSEAFPEVKAGHFDPAIRVWPHVRQVVVTGMFSLLVFISLGCGSDPEECTISGVGSGPCCTLNLPDGTSEKGVCKASMCQNRRYALPQAQCGSILDLSYEADFAVLKDAGMSTRDSSNERIDGAFTADAGSEIDNCFQVECSSTELCRSLDGRCLPRSFGRPGGACDSDLDCGSGQCTESMWSEGMTIGYCQQSCVQDVECFGGICSDELEPVCRRRCGGSGGCPDGWFCRSDSERSHCLPDCRIQGCLGQARCDDLTGICRAGGRCRYPCRRGESCEEGRCIRSDGTCLTDYHCRLNQFCHRGRCAMNNGTPCVGLLDSACSSGQRCIAIDDQAGVCALECERDDMCPLHFECAPRRRVCQLRHCETDGMANELLEPCSPGSHANNVGTCLPGLGNTLEGAGAPICIEGGMADLGDPCDEQSRGREAHERFLQCRAGALCVGDPDDSLEPLAVHAGRGQCALICSPDQSSCPDGHQCIRLGPRDDENTAEDESYPVGACLPSDCQLGEDPCPVGQACRPHTLWSRFGICEEHGPISLGGRCETHRDCFDHAQCLNGISGSICLALCGTGLSLCPSGVCYSEPTWAYGFCLD